MWSYPLTIVSLILFIFYQTYRYMIDYSIWLMLLTAFDIIMIILTFVVYQYRQIMLLHLKTLVTRTSISNIKLTKNN